MTLPLAPHARKVRVREGATGHVDEMWPVDARERVEHPKGDWTYVPDDTPLTDAVVVVAPPPAPLTPLTFLDGKSYKELQALARSAGILGNLPKADLIARLVPHIEGGTVSMDDVRGLPADLTAVAQMFPSADAG